LEIVVNIDSRKCWRLLIDGKNPMNFAQTNFGGKITIKRFLKRNYDIDLLSDTTIKRNYTEFRTKQVAVKKGRIYLVKSKR